MTLVHDRYRAINSPLHRLDPRVKLVTALLLIVGIVLTPERAWPAYPLLWALVGGIAAVGQLGVGRVARLGGVALPFALAAATLLFTTPGDPVISLAGLDITDNGLARFAAILLKSWLAVQVALLLSMSTHITDLLWALSSLRVPATLVAIISFMIRYLYTLQDEAQRLTRARAARSATHTGQRSGGSIRWRARVTGGLVGNLFLRSYERSERVYAAMLARGYRGELRSLDPPPLTGRAVLSGAGVIAALVVIELAALLLWG
ncbi:MAG: cobalt ECF transporter T component CbiQ [Anaerolineae bacterium]|nr:cobalt ECF transporter T component CbiQ [Anaerolineae bacterium]